MLRDGRGRAIEVSTSRPGVAPDSWAYTLRDPYDDSVSVDVWTPPTETGSPLMTRGLPGGAVLLGVDREDLRVVFLDPETGRVATILPQQSPRSGTTVPGIDVVQDYSSASRLFSDVQDDGTGGGVVDDTGRRLWSSDDNTPSTFSPDGRYVLGSRDTDLTLLDARTGERRGFRTEAGGPGDDDQLRDVVWEDDTHLLATRSIGDGRRALVRIALDGTITSLDVPTLAEDADLVWDTRP